MFAGGPRPSRHSRMLNPGLGGLGVLSPGAWWGRDGPRSPSPGLSVDEAKPHAPLATCKTFRPSPDRAWSPATQTAVGIGALGLGASARRSE
eukprot:1464382-Alexandrium_andersonii.AAC.1